MPALAKAAVTGCLAPNDKDRRAPLVAELDPPIAHAKVGPPANTVTPPVDRDAKTA